MIINSLLDTDFYKLSMMQAVFHQFPDTKVEYEFKCRSFINWGRTQHSDLSFQAPARIKKIKEEITRLCSIQFQPKEIDYLESLNIFQQDFLSYLKSFTLNIDHLEIKTNPFQLKIKGPWINTILFETPILAIISETYNKKRKEQVPQVEKHYKLAQKLSLAAHVNIQFADFGTRRRHSQLWHSVIVGVFSSNISIPFIGTSNIHFAMKYNLKPIGTMAHEWLMAGTSLAPSLRESQSFMLLKWLEEYKGKLGIALTDVISMDSFLKDFSPFLSRAYKGCRQDSGDPIIWGEKLIIHYEKLNIDPMTKTAVFSDGLTFPKAIEINDHFRNRINSVFGIGTNLTNDVGIDPLQIVIKMTSCNGKPVAKISDSPGKGMCRDNNHLKELKEAFGI